MGEEIRHVRGARGHGIGPARLQEAPELEEV
jgi:hypothetical protein